MYNKVVGIEPDEDEDDEDCGDFGCQFQLNKKVPLRGYIACNKIKKY